MTSEWKPIGEHVSGSNNINDQVNDSNRDASKDSEPKMVEEIESLCMECHKNGITRLLLTYIPYFKEVIVVSFTCDHCGNRNNEIQSAGQIQEKGCLYTVHMTTVEDLNRQVVRSEWCTLSIPELQIEIPPKKGQLTTVEGLVSDILRDLELDQPLRKVMQPEVHEKIEDLCDKLRSILGETKTEEGDIIKEDQIGRSKEDRTFNPFSLRVDDPSGNSFVEFMGDIKGKGLNDVKWSKRDYNRTKEQNDLLGLAGPADAGAKNGNQNGNGNGNDEEMGGGFKQDETEHENEEIFSFDGTCSSCNSILKTNMKKVNIPYFKDIIIMSTNCDACGYRDNEVKSGGAISPEGRKLTLKVQDSEDLSRDILKSETAGFEIPEIELKLSPGTLGGRFTTLEGLLQQVFDELSQRVMAGTGDSSTNDGRSAFETFLGKLKSVINGEACPYTVVLDDPLANSYIQNPYAPDKDEQIEVKMYTRSWDQNEDLGLNDINVDNYSEESNTWQNEIESRRKQARERLGALQETAGEHSNQDSTPSQTTNSSSNDTTMS